MNRVAAIQELIAVSRLLKSGVANDLMKKFQVRNEVWKVDATGKGFSAFVSDFPHGAWLDPWNRKIPEHSVRAIKDDENEITEWEASTTVEGKRVFLTIFND